MNSWQEKWEEYCEVLDSLALTRSKLNYMDRVEKRLYALAYREASGTVEERKTTFYASPEYNKFILERRDSDVELQRAIATRDQTMMGMSCRLPMSMTSPRETVLSPLLGAR